MFTRQTPMKLLLLAAVIALATWAQPAHAIKVCTYNLLNFPNDYLAREASFRIVMDEIDADLIVRSGDRVVAGH